MVGFVVIVILYAVIGLLAAAGAIFIARKILAPKAEQIFFALFLIMIAAFYLAFTAYFGVATAWRLETAVVVAFVTIGPLGARLPFALIVGYPLHGLIPRSAGVLANHRSRLEIGRNFCTAQSFARQAIGM